MKIYVNKTRGEAYGENQIEEAIDDRTDEFHTRLWDDTDIVNEVIKELGYNAAEILNMTDKQRTLLEEKIDDSIYNLARINATKEFFEIEI